MATFEEVFVEEYDRINADFMAGRYCFNVSEDVFDLKKIYTEFENVKTDPEILHLEKDNGKGL